MVLAILANFRGGYLYGFNAQMYSVSILHYCTNSSKELVNTSRTLKYIEHVATNLYKSLPLVLNIFPSEVIKDGTSQKKKQ